VSTSLPGFLGRVHGFKTKALRDRFASLDAAATARGRIAIEMDGGVGNGGQRRPDCGPPGH
jgi:hypothetical protein